MKKASITVSLLLLFAFPFFCFSESGRIVAVTAEKEVSIQNNDVSAARTVALSMAAREAVEKAFGTYIKVEEFPEARKVIASTAAGLQYNILGEKQRGNRYWVKIQANVLVPEEYAGKEEIEREDLGEPLKNFVQKYPQGEINWGEGFILAYGKGIIQEGQENAEDLAARAAEVDARGHLLEIVNDIPVDDRLKAGQMHRLSFQLQGFVQESEVIARARNGNTVNVTVKAPIRGVKGLAMTVYGYYIAETTPPLPKPVEPPKPKPEPKPAPPVETESFTGIVIDARAVPAAPALFPKIQDTSKKDVYTVNKVNKQDLEKRGVASYAMVARDVTISRLFPRAFIVRAAYEPQQQGEAPVKTKRRQGYRPLVVKAADAGGELKANLIISEADARKIQELDQKTHALKECRVVVVVASEVGGVEGRLILPLEL